MKKYLLSALMSVFFLTGVFSNTEGGVAVFPSIGICTPLNYYSISTSSGDKNFDTFGCNFLSIDTVFTINKIGLAFQAGGDLVGFSTSSNFPTYDDVVGFNFDIFGGIGYSVIRTERNNLSLFAIYQANAYDIAKTVKYTNNSFSITKYDDFAIFTNNIGGSIRYTFKFTDHFGVTVGVRAVWNLGGTMKETVTVGSLDKSYDYSLNSGYCSVYIREGITWIF
jgi:hypothetical protein